MKKIFVIIFIIISFSVVIHAENNEISKENIIYHVKSLESFQSRTIMHENNEKAGEYIYQELLKYGYFPKKDYFELKGRKYFNIVSDSSDKSKPIILLSAHFDSIAYENNKISSMAPGADDNAAGVAALMEIARILKKNDNSKNIEIVFFNAEEWEAMGSKSLAKQYKDNKYNIKYMVNIDTIGTWNGPLSETNPVNYVTDRNSETIINDLKKIFPYPLRKAKELWRDDHGNFWDKGYKAIEITEDGCTAHMHKTTDTAEKLNYDNISNIAYGIYLFVITE
jgi:Zn-dependent M28 family amino/carboxypeptidase